VSLGFASLHMQRRQFIGLTATPLGHFGCAAQGPTPRAADSGTHSLPRAVFIIGDSTAAIFPETDPRVG
jgi:hypothetical protein